MNRFLRYNHGLDIAQEEEDDEFGLPKTATVEMLEDEQYMYDVLPLSSDCAPICVLMRFSRYYCVGISTAFSIVNNLDKLMVATKELVGEQYHIHGIGIVQKGGYEPPTPGSTYPSPLKEV